MPEEARSWQGRPAGLVSRTLACALDLAVVLTVLAGGYLVTSGLIFVVDPVRFRFPSVSRQALVGAAAALLVGYLAGSWRLAGRTYGDHVLGLRVAGSGGRRLGWARALGRAALCTVFPAGLLWVAVSPARRSVQDVLLRTTVVYDWSPHSGAPGSRS
ncbi:hypothetical protein BA062_11770 [Prauserella flavalba]|uniref:RDD domain-containing protein n=1 Tax=Prauserella flavalba TaxID=1477506 RepID=A0A318LQY6_9PSEU|nr:hypothetical protein BA062_11770 [Prauserella flavalba]